MRKFKKTLAVVSAAAMTLAMGVTALADTQVTYHFYNAGNWDKVGAWVKQGAGWEEDCLPLDKCILKDTTDGTEPHEPIWPGATMEDEGGNWYKVTCTYTDFSKGSMMIFNNYIGDSAPGDTTSEADIKKLRDAGITLNDTAEKKQTQNIMIKKNTEPASDYYINWDGDSKGQMLVLGRADSFTAEAPEAYTNRNGGADASAASTDNTANANANANAGSTGNSANTNANAGSTDNSASANTNDSSASGTATNTNTSKGATSGTTSPKTGDTVAVSAIVLAIAAAATVVVSKKKANA